MARGKQTRVGKNSGSSTRKRQTVDKVVAESHSIKSTKSKLSRAQLARRRIRDFLLRRPHRSFRMTRRRDYIRSLELPGFWALVRQSVGFLLQHRKTFISLVIIYALVMIIIGGVTSQDAFSQIKDLLNQSSGDLFGGGFGDIGKAGLLAVSTFAGMPADLTIDQQIYMVIALLFTWLATVWLIREFMKSRQPRLRDGLYNSGAPFISTVILLALLALQLVPIGMVAILYAGFASVGLVSSGFGSMLFWIFASAVIALVLYWATSTIMALVVITLPGVYPWKAIRIASDVVLGRRLRVLYRLLGGLVLLMVVWVVVMIPLIIVVSALNSVWPVLDQIPIVPYVGAGLTALSTVLYASYVYIFYREVIDNE